MTVENIFKGLPKNLENEYLNTLVSKEGIWIERILSDGHTTAKGEWYDQNQDEWVLVLQGSGTLVFEDGSEQTLKEGDHLLIPAHQKHRVSHTAPQTLWLAVFFN